MTINLLYPLHLGFMILAFVVFAAGFVIGLFFLLQESQLKNHRPTALVRRLPALETMNAIHYKILTLGFVLLSLGILIGAVLSKDRTGRFFLGDPREIGALVMWALYALLLNMRWKAQWRGRRGILLALLGFIGVTLIFLGLEHRI